MELVKKPKAIRRVENYDYEEQIRLFCESNDEAFIPLDQTDTNRAKWHDACESYEKQTGVKLQHESRNVWRYITLCETHRKPITGMKECADGRYDSDYECDYKHTIKDEDNCCTLDDDWTFKWCKLRTIVIAKQSVDLKNDEDLLKLDVLYKGVNGRRECHYKQYWEEDAS